MSPSPEYPTESPQPVPLAQLLPQKPVPPARSSNSQFSLDEEIDELNRELGFRHGVYPKSVAAGRMTQGDADYHIAVLKSAVGRLKSLRYLLANTQLPF